MDIVEQTHGAVAVMRPVGALAGADASDVGVRASATARKHAGRLVIDAGGVPFADSVGLEMLVDLSDELAKSGRSLKVCSAGSTLRQAIELTGWTESFEFFADVNAAVRSYL